MFIIEQSICANTDTIPHPRLHSCKVPALFRYQSSSESPKQSSGEHQLLSDSSNGVARSGVQGTSQDTLRILFPAGAESHQTCNITDKRKAFSLRCFKQSVVRKTSGLPAIQCIRKPYLYVKTLCKNERFFEKILHVKE